MVFQDSILQQIGIYQFGLIEAKEIVFSNEVRRLCEQNVCGGYGTTWTCPPAVGTIEECKEKCLKYTKALVFSAKFSLEDSFDYEGMVHGQSEFKKVSDRLASLMEEKQLSDFLLLSNEGCMRCKECTYPHKPCRFPEKLFPSVESYGIMVNALAKSAKINYVNGQNTVTYFGLLLY